MCRIEDLKENDILTKEIVTEDYQILLSEGTRIRKEYIPKLKELGITEVYIRDEVIIENPKVEPFKKEAEKGFKIKVKEILEQHTYKSNEELVELSSAADGIISTILEEEEVVEEVINLKERNADIYEHSLSVCTLSILIALKEGLGKQQIHDIGVGGLLHDIGLRYIALNYVDKDIETLKNIDQSEFKKHTVYGYSALSNETWISETAKNIILSHHENISGSGYPLKAKNLSKECKIITVCDTFDEMISGIGYARCKVYQVVEYLQKNKGILFDNNTVDVFLNLVPLYPIGSVAITNQREEVIVIRQNRHFLDRPVLKIVRDQNGRLVTGDIIIDMVEQTDIFIEEVIR